MGVVYVASFILLLVVVGVWFVSVFALQGWKRTLLVASSIAWKVLLELVRSLIKRDLKNE